MADTVDGDEYQTHMWLVRHGETEWSRDGRHTSRTDLTLTAEGERAALAMRDKLAGRGFDLVVTSPRQRARRTAELSGFPDAEVWDDLREWDYGDYEGRTRAEIQAERPGWSLWTDGCPGGESPQAVADRVDGVIERCRRVAGDVLVFAHGHISRSLAVRWLEEPLPIGAHLELTTTRISVLGHDRGIPTLELWNAPDAP